MKLTDKEKKMIISLMKDGVLYLDSLVEAYADFPESEWYKKNLKEASRARKLVKDIEGRFSEKSK